MNQHDDGRGQDHGWEDPAEADLLKQTLGAMAGGVDPASPTGPAAVMPVMSKRVRRRRTAKLGGLGGGALALVAVLALGATQLAPPDRSDALPAAPTPSFRVKAGHQPLWLEKRSDLKCGMPVADLESTAPGWSVASAGDIYALTAAVEGRPSTSWGMAATVQEGPEGELRSGPALVWSQGGSIVDLGPNVFGPEGGPGNAPLIGSDPEGIHEARGSAASTCLPVGNGFNPDYESPLPEGDYEVRVVAFPEIGPKKWATVVSDPVAVRIDADGAHSATGTRGGESTIEPPKPVGGELSRFELDRTTDWVSAAMTHRGRMPAPAVSVTAQCESSNPADTVPFEVVLQFTGQVYRSGEVACDGTETVLPFGALGISMDLLDIRVPYDQGVPDGVARFWAVLEPSAGGFAADGGDGGCSASGLDVAHNPPSSPNQTAAATAQTILDAALACDYGELVKLANTAETELMVPAYAPEGIFALPETDALPYGTLAALLGGTTGGIKVEQEEGGPERETVVWPRVALDEFADSDEAWQEVVDAGLLSAEDAETQRANEAFGYQGAIVTIDEDGTWTALGAVGAFPRE
jgi:hypothetical protein